MVPYRFEDKDMLLITNAARGPMVMQVSGLPNAKGFTPENVPAPFMFDLSPHMPAGPVGSYWKTSVAIGLVSRWTTLLVTNPDPGLR
jgi:hypothetical protein